MLKITKLDFELGKNTEKIPNGLWYVVADYVKRGEDSYDRAKRRFAVTTIVSELNEIRERDDVEETDFRLILMAEINQIYANYKNLTIFEQDIIKYIGYKHSNNDLSKLISSIVIPSFLSFSNVSLNSLIVSFDDSLLALLAISFM